MSRRTTRSQTLCLGKSPVYTFPVNAKRKSTAAKKCGQPLTPITNLPQQNKSAINGQRPECTNAKNIQVTPNFPPPLKKAASATTKRKTPSNGKLNSSAHSNREKQKIAEQTLVFETCNTSRRMTRSQSVLLTKPPIDNRKRNSEPAKILAQSTPYKSTTKVLSTSLTSSKNINEVTPESSSISKESLAAAKTFPEGKSAPEATIANVPSAILDLARRRHTIESFPSEEIATSNQGQGKNAEVSCANDVTKITSNIVLRRSTRITRGVTWQTQENVTSKATASRASQPTKVSRRRHTVNPLQSTDGNVAIASSENEVTRSDVIAIGIQSNATKKRAYKGCKTSAYASANIIGTPVPSIRMQSKKNVTAFIKITEDLRQILLDDSKFINTSKKLYEIPGHSNIAEVIEEYVTIAGNEESNTWNSCAMTSRVLFHGIIEYCDVLIGRQLLYEPERAQYVLVLNNFPGVAVSKIYPPIYLLRLLVQLNELLHYSQISDESLQFSFAHLNRFIKYLNDNKSTFFKVSR